MTVAEYHASVDKICREVEWGNPYQWLRWRFGYHV